jgi:hypothetical protein
VSWHVKGKKWNAQCKRDGHTTYLGLYDNEEDAARACDWFAFTHGENHTKFNFGIPTHAPPGFESSSDYLNKRMRNGDKTYSSRYRGVSWNEQKQIWKAAIQVQKEKKYLGRFEYEEDAALAYNAKALELKGPNASINHVKPTTKTRYPPHVVRFTEEEILLMEGYGNDILSSLVSESEESTSPESPNSD